MNGTMRFLRWLGVTVWFGIWFLAPTALLFGVGLNDPRDPFPEIMSAAGCVLLAAGWIYLSAYYAIKDGFPPVWDRY